MVINILYICTGKYTIFFDKFYKSCQEYFFPNIEKKYYIFTDGEINLYNNIEKIHQDKLGWPNDTMMRFKMFNNIKNKMNDNDYVFFFNANILFNEYINDILPDEKNDYLIGVNHPGYYNVYNNTFPYERRINSNFYIEPGDGKFYFQGCFNGGRVREFMEMSFILEKKINDDLENGIVPIWHDESALNWYFKDKNPIILDPSYAYPESSNIPFDRKIIQIDKSKLGGHDYLRN